jgi:hypothetical protein
MEYHSTVFFASDKESHKVTIFKNKEPTYGWPFVVHIDNVSRHFQSESQVINFVNSIKQAYDDYRKEQGYDR